MTARRPVVTFVSRFVCFAVPHASDGFSRRVAPAALTACHE
jgi:hypothetical protein